MGENSNIEWTHHTFNPVWGCMEVSAACDFCYAKSLDKRVGGNHWGPHAPLREFGDKHWDEPRRWNDKVAHGERRRVFCASMADVFDNRWPDHIRPRLWALIATTPNLDWLLLTKRPQNIRKMLPENWGAGWPNVWLGTTTENQQEAERRVPQLLGIDAAQHFVSYEPALGPVDFRKLRLPGGVMGSVYLDALTGTKIWLTEQGHGAPIPESSPRILSWVIAGGESGSRARPPQADWFRSLRDECQAEGIAFHFKQWGGRSPKSNGRLLDGRTHDEFPAQTIEARRGETPLGGSTAKPRERDPTNGRDAP